MYKDLSVEESKNMLDSKEVNIIDVRLKEDYDREHISGAINIFFGDYDFDEQVDEYEKDEIYLIYCKIGVGSLKAIEIMEDLGFEKLYNMKGGIDKWMEVGYEVNRSKVFKD